MVFHEKKKTVLYIKLKISSLGEKARCYYPSGSKTRSHGLETNTDKIVSFRLERMLSKKGGRV